MCCLSLNLTAETSSNQEPGGTVITSHSLSFDQTSYQAVFEGDVQVSDSHFKMSTDRLVVSFSKDNEVQKLSAEGKVQIVREELVANSERAVYDVEEGKVVLSVNPKLRRGRDLLSGETITFWRDNNRILCEPNARLVFHSDQEVLKGIK